MPVILEAILTAKRPLFIFGGGAKACSGPARDAMRALGAACFETNAGRGVAGSYALNYGSYLARPESQFVIEQADVVVLVGTELSHPDLIREDVGIRGRLIQVDIDPAGFVSECEWPVLSTASDFFDHLFGALEGHDPVAEWEVAKVRSAKVRWRAEVDAATPHVLPVAEALRDCLPDATMIYSDMTQFAYVSLESWPMDRPGYWHHPKGFGTLGYSLPAAIGGAMARPDLPTCCIIGDYGIQYTIAELGTAVEQGLSLPILLWDNGKLGAIEDSMIGAQIAPKAVTAHNPDFVALAKAYGAYAKRPTTLEALAADVTEAFKADRPTLIHMTPRLSDPQ